MHSRDIPGSTVQVFISMDFLMLIHILCSFPGGGSLSLVPYSFQGGLCLWSHIPSKGVSVSGSIFLLGVSLAETPWTETPLLDGDPTDGDPPEQDRDPRTVKSAWYTYWWNAFLFYSGANILIATMVHSLQQIKFYLKRNIILGV